MESLDFVKIDVASDIRVGYNDVFLVVVQKIAAQIEQRFDFALVHFVFAVENEGREKRKTAVFSVQVPISALTNMVHKRLILTARNNSYLSDSAVDKVT